MNKEILTKQLLYRSIHRGCKETDFLIGEFAKVKLVEIDDLEMFNRFIEEDDMLIYDWILGKDEVPKRYEALIKNIREFHKI